MSNDTRLPTHDALIITNPNRRRDEKPFFLKIGAAWENQDGRGFYIKLHAAPLDGVVLLREPLPDDDQSDDRSTDRSRGR